MKKWIAYLLITSFMIFSLAGCGTLNEKTSDKSDKSLKESIEEVEEETHEYADKVYDVYENLDKYIGKTVTVVGFVKIDESYDENEFMVQRMLIDCCADDASSLGFITRFDDGDIPANDQWVKVTGTIDKESFKDESSGTEMQRPILNAEKIEKIDALPSIYITNYEHDADHKH